MNEWKLISKELPPLEEEVLIFLDNSQYKIAVMERMEEDTGHEFAFMVQSTYCYLFSEAIAWCEIPKFDESLLEEYRRGKSCQNSN